MQQQDPQIITDALAAFLVAERERCGLSQADLAAKVGKPTTFVVEIESAQRIITLPEFFMLTQGIGLDPITAMQSVTARLVSRHMRGQGH